MKISEILKGDYVISDLDATDKQATLTGLCRFLADKGVIQDQDSLLQAEPGKHTCQFRQHRWFGR